MTFNEAALEHLRCVYDLPNFKFITDDPMSCRAEFIHAINDRCETAYLYDDDVPRIIIQNITGFENSLNDPQHLVKMLISGPLMDYGGSVNIYEHLPQLIPPFSTEIFKNKSSDFSVNLGDLIEETDDKSWGVELQDNYELWLAGREEFLTKQIYSVMLSLEEQFPGITIAFLKSCFVSAFFNVDCEDDGTYDLDDIWDIFGWSLDVYDDYLVKSKDSKVNIEVTKTKTDSINKPEVKNFEDWDYNEQFFQSTE